MTVTPQTGAKASPYLYLYDEHEPLWLSMARDTFSTGALVCGALIVNTQMPPSGWINAAVALVWILWMAGRGMKLRKRMTPTELRAWLDAEHPEVAPSPSKERREGE